MPHPLLPYPNHRPICPVDALPDPLKQAVLYAIVKREVPPAVALIDAIAAAAAIVHCGYDCVTADGERMASTLFTLGSAPSVAGKGRSHRIFFRTFTEAMRRDMAERLKPNRTKANVKDALLDDHEAVRLGSATVEALVTEMTFFALLTALNGQGKNVAIQDEDAATFFESELFKRRLSRLTQLWSGDPPLRRAFGNLELGAVDGRCCIGLRTQPDILGEIPEAALRKAVKLGFFPRFLVGLSNPKQLPLNETYSADHGGEFSDRDFQARMACLALLINSRSYGGFGGRIGIELDTDAKAFMHELRWRMRGWTDAEYQDIPEAAGRAWENTLRVAVVLHVFCLGEGKVSREYVERAWAIVEWSLSQHRLVFIQSLPSRCGTAMRVPTSAIRQMRAPNLKPPKVPRPFEDAKWLMHCLSRLWAPSRIVKVSELNQLADLPQKRLASALKWLELEGLVRLTPNGSNTLIMPNVSGHPLSRLG